MITTIAEALALELKTTLSWLETTAGVAKPVTYSVPGAPSKVMPVACGSNCVEGDRYSSLVPDSALKSLLYFEDYGTILKEKDTRRYDCEATLRLVCWLNLAKLGIDDCTLSALAVSHVISAVPLQLAVGQPYEHVLLKVVEQLPKSPAIFSRYTYNEKQLQYLMWPYDYFALVIKAKFIFIRGCELPIITGDEICQ